MPMVNLEPFIVDFSSAMHFTLKILYLALANLPSAIAITGSRFLHLPVMKATSGSPPAHRRDEGLQSLDLNNTQNGENYLIRIGLGTPPQYVDLDLDTGSSNLWVNPNCLAPYFPADRPTCLASGRFDVNKSSSFVNLNQSVTLNYALGSTSVLVGSDDVHIGSAVIKNQILGVASSSTNLSSGILGVGRDSEPYDTFITNLFKQNVIQSRAFSLDLRSIGEPGGSVTFGGIDTGKYMGTLKKIPIANVPSAAGTKYWVALDQITLTATTDSTSRDLNTSGLVVQLDSGSTLSALPQDLYETLGSAFPTAQLDNTTGFYLVDCAVADQEGSVDYRFGDKVVSVLYKDAIFKSDQYNVCIFGAQGVPPIGMSFAWYSFP
jgi:hypothetical protein